MEQGLAAYAEARRLATDVKNRDMLSAVSIGETDAFLKLCDLDRVIAIGMADLAVFAELGPSHVWDDNILRSNVVEAIIGLGRPAEVEPIVADPGVDAVPPIDGWPLQGQWCLVRRLRGSPGRCCPSHDRRVDPRTDIGPPHQHKRELTATRMRVALWRGEPEEAESIARQELTELAETEEQALAADLLVLLARAEADIATQPPTPNIGRSTVPRGHNTTSHRWPPTRSPIIPGTAHDQRRRPRSSPSKPAVP